LVYPPGLVIGQVTYPAVVGDVSVHDRLDL
jgi:hypothetical protein